MNASYLIENVRIKKISDDDRVGVFEIEGLYRGYGVTVGNAMRRVLLSSLPGAAITRFKIKGVGHEFSTLPGVLEDVVEIGRHCDGADNADNGDHNHQFQKSETLGLKVFFCRMRHGSPP